MPSDPRSTWQDHICETCIGGSYFIQCGLVCYIKHMDTVSILSLFQSLKTNLFVLYIKRRKYRAYTMPWFILSYFKIDHSLGHNLPIRMDKNETLCKHYAVNNLQRIYVDSRTSIKRHTFSNWLLLNFVSWITCRIIYSTWKRDFYVRDMSFWYACAI